MTSYKTLYMKEVRDFEQYKLDIIKESRKESETPFICPQCEQTIFIQDSQIYCKNDDCSFNPTIDDLLNKLYKRND